MSPAGPVGPVSPAGPVGPVTVESAPVGPVGPVTVEAAPVAPVGPVGPVAPITVNFQFAKVPEPIALVTTTVITELVIEEIRPSM